ncbi:MAG: hypothetical protein K5925_04305 [Bacilli bacterium]|nr:hypothetical protein [Bacilli bacterium]
MKFTKYYLPLFALTMSLTSCGFGFYRVTYDTTALENKNVSAYSIFNIDAATTYDLETKKTKGKINIRYEKNKEYIPYITIEDYLSLLPFKREFVYKVYDSYSGQRVDIGIKDSIDGTISSYYYAARFLNGSKTVQYQGGFNSAMTTYEDKPELIEGLDTKERIVGGQNSASYANYYNFNFNSYLNNDLVYYPLMFLNTVFSDDSGINVIYDMDKLFVFSDYKDASNFVYSLNDEECRIYTATEKYAHEHNQNVMPKYLRDFNRDILLFTMDNYYGIKTTRGINSMISYYKSSGLYDKFVDEDASIRNLAISEAINKLNDDHTGIIANFYGPVWGDLVTTERGEDSKARSAAEKLLSDNRKAVYENSGLTLKDVRYSSDGKVAVIVFDAFMEEDIPLLVENLNKVVAKGGVEKVVLDISTNGGGYLANLYKALAIISEDPVYSINFHIDTANVTYELYGEYDANGDEKYDKDDCYGDDFKFYILTSKASFSCGNAFPCDAKVNGLATIIGETSGGGECAVATHLLGNHFFFQHSSINHLGTYKNGRFIGFEPGATPDISLSYDDFYDIEKIAEAIK